MYWRYFEMNKGNSLGALQSQELQDKNFNKTTEIFVCPGFSGKTSSSLIL